MDPKLYRDIATHKAEALDRIRAENLAEMVTKFQKNTILHVAVLSANAECVSQILDDPSGRYRLLVGRRNERGDTALHLAARLGHRHITELLVGAGSSADSTNEDGNMALHEATIGNSFEVAEWLIRRDPSLATRNTVKGESALFLAVDRRFHRIAGVIAGAAPPCSVSGRNGMNAIQAAAIRSRTGGLEQRLLEVVGGTILLQRPRLEKNIESYSNDAITLIIRSLIFSALDLVFDYIIASKDKPTLIDTLCDRHEETNVLKLPDDFGWTSLHYFAHLGNVDLVKRLLQPDDWSVAYEKDKDGMSALHIAARDGQVGVVNAIIERCPDACESLDNRNRTALHVASRSKRENIVKILVKATAFVNLLNEKDIEGDTALHIAASVGHYGIVDLLSSDKRVDLGAMNKLGMTALDAVISNTQLNESYKALIIAMLRKKGGEPSLERKVLRSPNHDAETSGLGGNASRPNSSSSSPTTTNDDGVVIRDKTKRINNQGMNIEQIKSTAELNLIVATIITSITFAAGIAVPGGFNGSNGMASLKGKGTFTAFLVWDSMAFGCAASSMLIHFLIGFISCSNIEMYGWYPFECVLVLTTISIASAVIAFFFGTNAVLWRDLSDNPFPGYITAISFVMPLVFVWYKFLEKRLFRYYFRIITS